MRNVTLQFVALIFAGTALSGCFFTKDPLALLPPAERAFLANTAKPSAATGPISVRKMLARILGSETTDTKDNKSPETMPSETLDVDFDTEGTTIEPSTMDRVIEFSEKVPRQPGRKLEVLINRKRGLSAINAYRNAIAVTKVLDQRHPSVIIKLTNGLPPNILRISAGSN